MNLVYLCRHYNLPEVADYWEQVIKLNEYQTTRFVRNMVNVMFNSVAGKKIAVLGFAFKADTGDTRESPACTVCRQLLAEHAHIAIYDPKAMENARLDLANESGQIDYCTSPEEAVKDAHAIVIATEWKEFSSYDYGKFYEIMQKPAFIFDGRNILAHRELFELGFNVFPVGQKALTHF